MSDIINDGGPAFPQGHLEGPHIDPSGMSLRDWLAGMALQGMLACPEWKSAFDEYAKESYEMADAMLKEREK